MPFAVGLLVVCLALWGGVFLGLILLGWACIFWHMASGSLWAWALVLCGGAWVYSGYRADKG
jgi:hypothetical protein